MSRAENCTGIERGNKSGKQSCNGSVQVWSTYLILKLLYQNGLSRAIAKAHCDSGYYTKVALVGCTEEYIQKASLTPK